MAPTHAGILLLLIASLISFAHCRSANYLSKLEDFGDWMHQFNGERPNLKFRAGTIKAEGASFWYKSQQDAVRNKLHEARIEKQADNIIMFLGDGMSLQTCVAARILKGQLEGLPFGEEGLLHFEKFPHTGFAKTFCTDSQVADSACSATAYLCGTKANIATIGVTPAVHFRDCNAQMNVSNHAMSLLEWAQAAGKSTGVITTTRITHASPAGTYAKIADRDWENDQMIRSAGQNPEKCDDIAEQLILSETGKRINVIMGGGRRELTPKNILDIESKQPGRRSDGKNLIETWKSLKRSEGGVYAHNREQLMAVNTSHTKYLLGLFAYDHMDYVLDSVPNEDPSLPEMTRIAIEILSQNPKGFFLFVEGGRIDHAHHSSKAQKALIETISMDAAVQTASTMTREDDTLIVVTADHSHVMTISGYPQRGNPILGFAGISDMDELPYTTLSYSNGPGYKHPEENGDRYDLTNDNLEHPDYMQMTGLPLLSETHGGDDVPIYSRGPFAHLLTGVQDQSYIPHALGFAACMGPGLHFCSTVQHQLQNQRTSAVAVEQLAPVPGAGAAAQTQTQFQLPIPSTATESSTPVS